MKPEKKTKEDEGARRYQYILLLQLLSALYSYSNKNFTFVNIHWKKMEDGLGPWLLATLIKSLCFYALIESLCFSPPFPFPPMSWEWDESNWLIYQTFAGISRFGTCACYNLYLAGTKIVYQIYWPVLLTICQIHDKYNTEKYKWIQKGNMQRLQNNLIDKALKITSC